MGIFKTRIDLTGQRFGRLVVVEYSHSHRGFAYWKCKCDCGNTKVVSSSSLRNGNTSSCGCLCRELTSIRRKKHGMTKTRIYKIYRAMVTRCTNPNINEHHRYVDRGIAICDEWLGEKGFENFRDWSYQNGYNDTLSIDRIDNDKGYSPQNCRWADSITQANNTSSNHNITVNGETHTMMEWSRITGISYDAIKSRINKLGWTEEQALGFVKKRNITKTSRMITIDGETYTMAEWARIMGIKYGKVDSRIQNGWTEREALEFDKRVLKSNRGKQIEIDGEVHNFTDWCKLKNVSYEKARYQFRQGLSAKEALEKAGAKF